MIKISVIIPTWCEAGRIAQAIDMARAVGDEIIVADPGSPDSTGEVARSHGAQLVRADKGRGCQLRAGAAAASGEVLLFLHADAELPVGARDAILCALRDPDVVGGNFLLAFEGDTPFAKLYSVANDLRRRWFRVYYGDSGIFVRRPVYEALGGFKPYPIFEDYEFVRRLEQRGRTAYVRDVAIRVSARRFESAPLKTLANWALLHGLYSFLRVHPDRLAVLYAHVR